ncbi:MAG: 4-alpha-glucanotransferase [Treponema sp.]|nr:4-alpha-glucanotransferase [Treponema sp.]
MSKPLSLEKLTGVVVPLGAIYTKENSIIGEFADLIPFSEFCKKANIKIIQLLPVNDTGTQSSPYSGLSAFALHPIYIRLNEVPGFTELYETNQKFKKDYTAFVKAHKYTNRYDYDEILNSKNYFLREIYNASETGTSGKASDELKKFIKANPWVTTYSVYKNLKWKYMQASWKSWDKADQKKSAEEITALWNDKKLAKEHLFYVWTQFIAAQQFEAAVKAVHQQGILLKGDMPILMNEDSCDAWAYPQYFNQDLRAGSPADGENPTGQNWGFPTYNWKNLKADNYCWWIDRLKSAEKYYDAYRLDHILGFFRIWAIPSGDCNALNGHTEPYAFIKKDELYELGFDDDRIRWLSQPHVPTSVIEDVTWNHEVAHNILETLCDRIGNEELWLFNKKVTGSQYIWDCDLSSFVDDSAAYRIKDALVNYWSNRTLLEVAKNKFVPMWTYNKSTSWGTLNAQEITQLTEMFDKLNKKNEKLWAKQADEIFTAICSSVKMKACGEDLGVGIACVPEVMEKHNILGLRVIRWSRKWSEEGQPYVPFEDYTPLSVATTSVHDSSTIRQWFEAEPELPFLKSKETVSAESTKEAIKEELTFTPEIACTIMKECGKSASMWYISPLQDFLYINKKYWLENSDDERINVPGTVNKFNWTYRLPVSLEDLNKDKKLIEQIKDITKRN